MNKRKGLILIVILMLLVSSIGYAKGSKRDNYKILYNYQKPIEFSKDDLIISGIKLGGNSVSKLKQRSKKWVKNNSNNLDEIMDRYQRLFTKKINSNKITYTFNNQNYKTKSYGTFLIIITKNRKTNKIDQIFSSVFRNNKKAIHLKTNRGITQGSTVKEVIKKYGVKGKIYIYKRQNRSSNIVSLSYIFKTKSNIKGVLNFTGQYNKNKSYMSAKIYSIEMKKF
jgi:hypothetical protein